MPDYASVPVSFSRSSLCALMFAAAACRSEPSSTFAARSEVAPETSVTRAEASLFGAKALERARGAIRERVGGDAAVLSIEIFSNRLLIQVANTARDGVVAYEWSADQLRGPLPVELRGTGTLSHNVFPLSSVELSSVPELARAARARVDSEHGEVTRVLIRRNLPSDDDVVMRAYVASPIRSGQLDADAGGRLLR